MDYNLFISPIIDSDANQHGYNLDGVIVSNLKYADDITLLSAKYDGIQNICNRCNEFACNRDCKFHPIKSKAMICGHISRAPRGEIRLGDIKLTLTASQKLLGITIRDRVRGGKRDGEIKQCALNIRRAHACRRMMSVQLMSKICNGSNFTIITIWF